MDNLKYFVGIETRKFDRVTVEIVSSKKYKVKEGTYFANGGSYSSDQVFNNIELARRKAKTLAEGTSPDTPILPIKESLHN